MYQFTYLFLCLIATTSVVQSVPLLADKPQPDFHVSNDGSNGDTKATPYNLAAVDGRLNRLRVLENQLMYRRGTGATPPPANAAKKTTDSHQQHDTKSTEKAPQKQAGSTAAEKTTASNAVKKDTAGVTAAQKNTASNAHDTQAQDTKQKKKCHLKHTKNPKQPKTLSRRMDEYYQDAQGQSSQQAGESSQQPTNTITTSDGFVIPLGRDRGSNPPSTGAEVSGGGLTAFGKVYRHRTRNGVLIKVIGPKSGWTDTARLDMVQNEVGGLMAVGQYKDEWGQYTRKGKTYYYLYMKYIPGVQVDLWGPYRAVEADEVRRVALVRQVVVKVKQRAWYYYVNFGVLHSDPNPGNVLITGTESNFRVDFIDWANPQYQCQIDEAGLDQEIDSFWYEMFERHADSPASG